MEKQRKWICRKTINFFHEFQKTQFAVKISNYGPLGFYNTSNNTITINLNNPLDVIETIKHEMVHIMIEPFIRKYRVDQASKEFIVETILKILKKQEAEH
jgi:hypothetical protein